MEFSEGTFGVQGEQERAENCLTACYFDFFVNYKHVLCQLRQEIVKFHV